MANPLISQGTLNKLVASVTWNDFPSLNVTPPYLNREGIRLALEGNAVEYLGTLTGAVTSPNPYQMVTLTLNILKTQGLAALYKSQQELNALLGNGVVRPDSVTLPPYELVNCAIESVRELDFSGAEPGFSVTIRGYYEINSSLWG